MGQKLDQEIGLNERQCIKIVNFVNESAVSLPECQCGWKPKETKWYDPIVQGCKDQILKISIKGNDLKAFEMMAYKQEGESFVMRNLLVVKEKMRRRISMIA